MVSDKEYIYFNRPTIDDSEVKSVSEVIRSGWLTTGPKTKEFEKQFAKYSDSRFALGLNSCTAGLHLSLIALGIGPGDEVITTPITFAATVNVIELVGAKPVFVDVRKSDLNIDENWIEDAITPKTKAIMPVHFAGEPCEMDEIARVANKYKLWVIEDAAHAIESKYRDKKIGSISTTTSFSFYATKNITTGEGGMITTQDNELHERLSILSLHGISKDAWKRYSDSGYQHWEILYPGFKYNMFDIQAAMGLEQLKKVDDLWETRKEIVKKYDDFLKDYPEVITLKWNSKNKCAYHLYVIQVMEEHLGISRDEVLNKLQENGIGVGVHFRCVHLQKYYKEKYGFKEGMFPNAEYASERVLSLPLYPTLTNVQLDRITENLVKIVYRS